MIRRRFTISGFMAATAVLCVNIGWIRAFLLSEGGGYSELFDAAFLLGFTLQFGVWRSLSTRRRRRRSWLAFVASGAPAMVALMVLFGGDNDLHNAYLDAASDLAYHILPARVDVVLSTTHWDWFLAIVYFLPVLLIQVAVGLLAGCVSWKLGEAAPTPAT